MQGEFRNVTSDVSRCCCPVGCPRAGGRITIRVIRTFTVFAVATVTGVAETTHVAGSTSKYAKSTSLTRLMIPEGAPEFTNVSLRTTEPVVEPLQVSQ